MNLKINSPRTWIPVLVFIVGLFLAGSCNQQSQGFALPQGDVEAGKTAFMNLSCNQCHHVADIEWKGSGEDLNILLGGGVTKMKSYGDLVTSVINPSHKISINYMKEWVDKEGKSKMNIYNEVMTVQELVDIVTFLQSEYKFVPPPPTYYPSYR